MKNYSLKKKKKETNEGCHSKWLKLYSKVKSDIIQ